MLLCYRTEWSKIKLSNYPEIVSPENMPEPNPISFRGSRCQVQVLYYSFCFALRI